MCFSIVCTALFFVLLFFVFCILYFVFCIFLPKTNIPRYSSTPELFGACPVTAGLDFENDNNNKQREQKRFK